MVHSSTPAQPLAGWYVISLRPRGGHAALRRAAALRGAKLLALSPWRIEGMTDAATRAALHAALAADRVIATSPAAVRAAVALQALESSGARQWIAIGEGTASALRRAGIANVETPLRMDSEGVLALSTLRDVRGCDVGLLTAPGGRDRIEPALRGRGARVLRADIYRRVPTALSQRGVRALLGLDGPALLALSSGEAFLRTLGALPADGVAVLRRCLVVAASERLAALARAHGFERIVVAKGARPRDLMTAAAAARAT